MNQACDFVRAMHFLKRSITVSLQEEKTSSVLFVYED